MTKLDIRPKCVACGRRWMPPEGVDAQSTTCEYCAEMPENLGKAIESLCALRADVRLIIEGLRSAKFYCVMDEAHDGSESCVRRFPDSSSMWCPDCIALDIIQKYGHHAPPQ